MKCSKCFKEAHWIRITQKPCTHGGGTDIIETPFCDEHDPKEDGK